MTAHQIAPRPITSQKPVRDSRYHGVNLVAERERLRGMYERRAA